MWPFFRGPRRIKESSIRLPLFRAYDVHFRVSGTDNTKDSLTSIYMSRGLRKGFGVHTYTGTACWLGETISPSLLLATLVDVGDYGRSLCPHPYPCNSSLSPTGAQQIFTNDLHSSSLGRSTKNVFQTFNTRIWCGSSGIWTMCVFRSPFLILR